MRYEQRAYARVKFLELMAELYENEFEDFFHRLMCSRYPDFLDVRTAGSLGDMSADGLTLHSRKLYACYAPQTVKPSKIRKKFNGDLARQAQRAVRHVRVRAQRSTRCSP
jgi:hypothetical protein